MPEGGWLPSLQLDSLPGQLRGKERKEKNHQLMDYVCLATSYSTEQVLPQGPCGVVIAQSHIHISWTRQVLSSHMATHDIVSDCLSLAWEKEVMLPTKMTLHTVSCPQNMPPTFLKTINAAFITKCYFICEALPGECSFLAFPMNPVQPGHTQKKC